MMTASSWPDRDAGSGQMAFGIRNSILSEMEDRRGQDGVSAPRRQRFDHVVERSGAARCDYRDVDRTADRFEQRKVVSVFGAVPVHARDQELTGSELGGAPGPFDGVEPGPL